MHFCIKEPQISRFLSDPIFMTVHKLAVYCGEWRQPRRRTREQRQPDWGLPGEGLGTEDCNVSTVTIRQHQHREAQTIGQRPQAKGGTKTPFKGPCSGASQLCRSLHQTPARPACYYCHCYCPLSMVSVYTAKNNKHQKKKKKKCWRSLRRRDKRKRCSNHENKPASKQPRVPSRLGDITTLL